MITNIEPDLDNASVGMIDILIRYKLRHLCAGKLLFLLLRVHNVI